MRPRARVDPFTRAALAGVRGVDLLLAARQAPVAAGVRVEAPRPLRDPDRGAAALVGGIGDRVDLASVERVDDAVLAGGAYVVPGASPGRSRLAGLRGPR